MSPPWSQQMSPLSIKISIWVSLLSFHVSSVLCECHPVTMRCHHAYYKGHCCHYNYASPGTLWVPPLSLRVTGVTMSVAIVSASVTTSVVSNLSLTKGCGVLCCRLCTWCEASAKGGLAQQAEGPQCHRLHEETWILCGSWFKHYLANPRRQWVLWDGLITSYHHTGPLKTTSVQFSPLGLFNSAAQTVQNRPVNSQFVSLSFTAIRSFFYINQPAQTADLRSM